jgi:DNA-binding CsgD family transcriptional regulator/tetratricopeptide (TPR) repeat protein
MVSGRPPERPARDGPGAVVVHDWPLVGRVEERELVVEVIRRGGHVVLAGPAGVGKTRLLHEALGALAADGFAIDRVAGTRAAAAIPFGAMAPLLPAPTAGGVPETDLTDMLGSFRTAVAGRAHGRGLVLGVDDAHCLDPASATLVHQLAATTGTAVVVAQRSGEPVPDAITALWKDALAERIELQPLADAEIRSLLEAVLGGPVEEATAREIVRRCAGNCLFLRELVRAARDEGRLEAEHGRWRLRGDLAIGAGLVELVESHTGGLPEGTRAVLEHLALGEPLPLAVLDRIATPADIDDAARRELIDVAADPQRATVRLSHPLYGEVLRSRLSGLRTRSLAADLVRAFATTPLRRADDVVRFASWSLDAGLPAPPDLLARAVRHALEAGDHWAAERFAAAAVTARRPGTGATVDEHAAAVMTLADAIRRQRRYADSLAVLDQVEPGLSSAVAAKVAELRANCLFLGAGTTAEALDLLEAAAGATDEPLCRVRLHIARARLLNGAGRPREALAMLDDVAATDPDPRLEPLLLSVRGPTLAFLGRFDEADAVVARGFDPALTTDEEVPPALSWTPSTILLTTWGRAQLDHVEQMTRSVLATGLSLRHPAMRRMGSAATGWALLQRGRINEAADLLAAGTDDTAGLDIDGVRALAFGGLACAQARAGDVAAAAATVARAEEAADAVRVFEHVVTMARALTAHRRGQRGQARAIVRDGLAACEDTGQHHTAVPLAMTATSVGAADLAERALARLAPVVEGALLPAARAHASAMAAGDGDALDAASEALASLGLLLAAAEAAAGAGAAHEEAGRDRQALASRARSRRLLEQCPGADGSFVDAHGPSPVLTVRELEIAELAAAGLSSAAIADRLFISVRTVDSHLSRVYLKLGVPGRAELRDHPALGTP